MAKAAYIDDELLLEVLLVLFTIDPVLTTEELVRIGCLLDDVLDLT